MAKSTTRKALVSFLRALETTYGNGKNPWDCACEIRDLCAAVGAKVVDDRDTSTVLSAQVILRGQEVGFVTVCKDGNEAHVRFRETSPAVWRRNRKEARANDRLRQEAYNNSRNTVADALRRGEEVRYVPGGGYGRGGTLEYCGHKVAAINLLTRLGFDVTEEKLLQICRMETVTVRCSWWTDRKEEYFYLCLFPRQAGRPGSIEWEMTA